MCTLERADEWLRLLGMNALDEIWEIYENARSTRCAAGAEWTYKSLQQRSSLIRHSHLLHHNSQDFTSKTSKSCPRSAPWPWGASHVWRIMSTLAWAEMLWFLQLWDLQQLPQWRLCKSVKVFHTLLLSWSQYAILETELVTELIFFELWSRGHVEFENLELLGSEGRCVPFHALWCPWTHF